MQIDHRAFPLQITGSISEVLHANRWATLGSDSLRPTLNRLFVWLSDRDPDWLLALTLALALALALAFGFGFCLLFLALPFRPLPLSPILFLSVTVRALEWSGCRILVCSAIHTPFDGIDALEFSCWMVAPFMRCPSSAPLT